jgi:hypothetical protein
MNMNLKGIMQTLGAKPGQVMSDPYARAWAPTPSPIKEAEGEDHEVSMAQNSLDTIIKMATELKDKMGENEKDIPAWIQDHITNAENFISQASSNYHEYSTNEAGINGAPRYPSLDGVANESVNEVSYNVKADNAYQFINGAAAVLGMYVKDEKLESGVKSTLQRVVKDLEGLRKYFFSRKDESINEAFEVHYSDGIRAAKKFGNEKQAVDFAKDLVKNKKGLQFVDVFNAGSGFNSTADTNAIVAWWGKGSYTDNKSKNDSKLAAKKIKESLRLTNLK